MAGLKNPPFLLGDTSTPQATVGGFGYPATDQRVGLDRQAGQGEALESQAFAKKPPQVGGPDGDGLLASGAVLWCPKKSWFLD